MQDPSVSNKNRTIKPMQTIQVPRGWNQTLAPFSTVRAENLRGKLITKAWILRNTGKTHQPVAAAAISVRIADQADWLGSW